MKGELWSGEAALAGHARKWRMETTRRLKLPAFGAWLRGGTVRTGGFQGTPLRGITFRCPVAIWALCWIAFLGLKDGMVAANVTNYLDRPGWPNQVLAEFNMAVNVGDTVVWLDRQVHAGWTNYVESYDGQWGCSSLPSGEAFSHTFTRAGFYAYDTRPYGPVPAAGTVTVMGWTGAPPAVTINTPVDGSVLEPGWYHLVRASVTNAANLARIEYYANSKLIGIGTNASESVWGPEAFWEWAPPGQYVLEANAIDLQGKSSWSRPVHVSVGPEWFGIWGARRLPSGEMLFYFNAFPTQTTGYLAASDTPSFAFFTNYIALGNVSYPGVFVDEGTRGASVQRRFYTIFAGHGGDSP
jgi:Bacterial Ig domain